MLRLRIPQGSLGKPLRYWFLDSMGRQLIAPDLALPLKEMNSWVLPGELQPGRYTLIVRFQQKQYYPPLLILP